MGAGIPLLTRDEWCKLNDLAAELISGKADLGTIVEIEGKKPVCSEVPIAPAFVIFGKACGADG